MIMIRGFFSLLLQLFFITSVAFPIVDPGKDMTVYDEAYPMLYASHFVYDIADLVLAARKGKVQLNSTDVVTDEMMSYFSNTSLDFTSDDANGLAFSDLIDFLKANMAGVMLGKSKKEKAFEIELIQKIDQISGHLYLSTFRSLQQKVSCVYGVVKDTMNKRIIIIFRGSETRIDWFSNFNIVLENMRTPTLVKEKLKKPMSKTVKVHKGFYQYIFDNSEVDVQRYDKIREDIEPLMEDGYSVYVTGHSLGGALATITAFKLAGTHQEWLPRPITAITFASPITGTTGYRKAFEQCEKDGLLRHLRVVLPEDPVPTIPPFGVGRTLKHVGINLRLVKNKSFKILHHTLSNTWSSLRNSLFGKPIWQFAYHPDGHPHTMSRYYKRFVDVSEDLKNIKIDDIYQDTSVVSEAFSTSLTKLEVPVVELNESEE